MQSKVSLVVAANPTNLVAKYNEWIATTVWGGGGGGLGFIEQFTLANVSFQIELIRSSNNCEFIISNLFAHFELRIVAWCISV